MSDNSASKADIQSAEETDAQKPKRTFKERIFHNFREFLAMFLYLWILFALFNFHKALVLAQHNIDYKPYGLALFNAFILAKIMLVAEEMNLATKFRKKGPIFPILHKSFLFALILVAFTFVEKIVTGFFRGKSIADSMPKIGSGSPTEIIIASLIIAIALIPFFAFRELSRVMGKGVLGTLLLRGRALDRLAESQERPR